MEIELTEEEATVFELYRRRIAILSFKIVFQQSLLKNVPPKDSNKLKFLIRDFENYLKQLDSGKRERTPAQSGLRFMSFEL